MVLILAEHHPEVHAALIASNARVIVGARVGYVVAPRQGIDLAQHLEVLRETIAEAFGELGFDMQDLSRKNPICVEKQTTPPPTPPPLPPLPTPAEVGIDEDQLTAAATLQRLNKIRDSAWRIYASRDPKMVTRAMNNLNETHHDFARAPTDQKLAEMIALSIIVLTR